MTSALQSLQNKIMTKLQLQQQVDQWRKEGDIIVFSNGCFDILHAGHVQYLAKASELGSRLILGLNTDLSVKRLKGDNRPVLDENARLMLLASLFFVDAVCLFDEQTPLELIKSIIPDVLVKGKDYAVEDVVGYDVVVSHGGKVETIDLVPGYSTSSIIEKIKMFY